MVDSLAVQEIASSNIPQRKKSAIMNWYEGLTRSVNVTQNATNHVREGVHALRSGFEAMGTGLTFGILEAERGLDVGDVPIDGVVAALGYLGSVWLANDPYGISLDMRNIASDSLAILTYRKTKLWREKGKATTVTHGEIDPIIAAANDLDF
jgi:hypothetical protein